MTEAALARAPAPPPSPTCCRAATPPPPPPPASSPPRATGSRPGSAAGGRVSNAALEADQAAAHGLAWIATYAEALRQLAAWAARARRRRPPRRDRAR